MREPRWIPRFAVEAVQLDQIREHGGMPGVRDENALESALQRPRNKWIYEPGVDLAYLAASYGFGLSSNHPYHDGKKRIAFMAMAIFLELNDYELEASEAEVVTVLLNLAAGQLDEANLATWIRLHTRPL